MTKTSREFDFVHFGKTRRGRLIRSVYQDNGATAVCLEELEDGTWFPYTTLSVNIDGSEFLPPGVFVMKTYSENSGLDEQLLELGAIRPFVEAEVPVGPFVTCPIMILDDEFFGFVMHGPECDCNECLEMVECGDFDMGGEG